MAQTLQLTVFPSSHYTPALFQSEIIWKPTKLQHILLKLHFSKNEDPTEEEKYAILADIKEQTGSRMTLNQLNNWFEKEKIKRSENVVSQKEVNKCYRKFTESDLNFLSAAFETKKYPKLEEMVQYAKKLDVKLSKIENWYKHSRRNLAKQGQINLKKRRYFEKEELDYIQERFDKDKGPNKVQLCEIAEHLQCDISQVKNWFANKKKKLRRERTAKKEICEEKEEENVKSIRPLADSYENRPLESLSTGCYTDNSSRKASLTPEQLIGMSGETRVNTNNFQNINTNNIYVNNPVLQIGYNSINNTVQYPIGLQTQASQLINKERSDFGANLLYKQSPQYNNQVSYVVLPQQVNGLPYKKLQLENSFQCLPNSILNLNNPNTQLLKPYYDYFYSQQQILSPFQMTSMQNNIAPFVNIIDNKLSSLPFGQFGAADLQKIHNRIDNSRI